MALQKQPISLNFSSGLNTKTDPYQVPVGQFLDLQNSVFDTQGRLTKRNGFENITNLPNAEQTTLTTLNDNLLATGSNLYSYNENSQTWINKGVIQPVHLSVQSITRSSTGQSSPDCAVNSKGLACTAYIDSNGSSYYQLSDSTTGEQIVSRVLLPNSGTSPRVFILGQYFIVTFLSTIVAATHLQYIAIPMDQPSNPLTVTNISSNVKSLTGGYDCYVANNTLYVAYATSVNTVNVRLLTSALTLSASKVFPGLTANLMSVTADITGSTAVIWITFWDSVSMDGYAIAINQSLQTVLLNTQIINNVVINEISSVASNMVLTVFYENNNTYGAGPLATTKTDYISTMTVTQGGVVGTPSVILRSVGLASKAFTTAEGITYMLATYGETNQPTYFLIDSSGHIYMRLAYSNGGGYEATQILPSVSYYNGNYIVPYLIKDFLTSVNKGTDLATGIPTSAIYTQTGINIAEFSINSSGQYSSEIASALHLTGGQLWEYDGIRPVEHGFHVYPENVAGTISNSGGSIANQTYYYQFCYEWTDNQGNLQRSAPSIPAKVVMTGSNNTTTLYVPTLRLTYKVTPNVVRIVGYRWSTAQQTYYQFTSITSPVLNNPAVDYVTIVDTLADSSIIGNAILYTTGGVLENIAAPASIHSALFNNRLWIIDAEDPNLLWFSKQVIEAVPVEMSDLLTIYVAPTSGAQGSTGPSTALSAMDDKLIIFKKDAIYYINGVGPDNTGANSNYSDAIFIAGSVGCANPSSIVLTPNGLMFQSDKGIWLLSRDLQTKYIGNPVEKYNDIKVVSAQAIPATNEIRFILENNIMLVYDYYYDQWGTFSSKYAISSTLYQGLHTYLNSYGKIFQETPGLYLDGSDPVLMSFTTAWISVAGLQGFERMYFGYLLGTYYTPFKLSLQLAYNYNSSATQTISILPDNYVANWGGEALWGSNGPWGGPGNVFKARFFPQSQKCETIQITINEIYDSSYGQSAGAGLTLSGLDFIIGVKKGYRTQSAKQSFG